jgi:hypothetical protein
MGINALLNVLCTKAQVLTYGVFDLGEFVPFEEKLWITMDIHDIDGAYLVYEKSGQCATKLDFGSEDGGLSACRRWNHRGDTPW